ncbi:protein of unknown function [Xenorhabdus bovienii]|uniref:Uncharacterized protein n=2 Tax=Xenorhabdus bovienii TaxID=40576 RepID=A0A0B6X7V6_XENBV|nr:hypothetical protein XBKB1_3820001 [Xenorhabdus bovienii str. kraussei Becker Underwood]CDM89997.1 protein of unknown function [Xenorhabdus bovienii]
MAESWALKSEVASFESSWSHITFI